MGALNRIRQPYRSGLMWAASRAVDSHTAEIVKEISESREPMLITQNGEAKLVVMDVASYERQEETLALLKILAMGSRDIEQGYFRDADEVFGDLDKECK